MAELQNPLRLRGATGKGRFGEEVVTLWEVRMSDSPATPILRGWAYPFTRQKAFTNPNPFPRQYRHRLECWGWGPSCPAALPRVLVLYSQPAVTLVAAAVADLVAAGTLSYLPLGEEDLPEREVDGSVAACYTLMARLITPSSEVGIG